MTVISTPDRPGLRLGYRLVIQAFFDDSGKQDSTNFVTIAGFLGDAAYWGDFSLAWTNLLRRWEVSQVHMKDLMTSNREFKGWTEAKRQLAMSEFIHCINKYRLIGYGISVDAKFWNTLPLPFQKEHGDAQTFAFERVIRRIRDNMTKTRSRDLIALTFDCDRDFAKPRLTRIQKILDN